MNIIVAIIAIVAALVLGGVCGFLIFRFVIKGKYNEMVSWKRRCSSATSTFNRMRTS